MPQPDAIRVLHYFAFPGGGIGRYAHELLSEMASHPELEVELACIPSYQYREQASYRLWPGLREITHPRPWRRRMRFAINLVVNPLRAIRRARLTGAQILHLSTIPHVTFALWSRTLRRSGLRLVATAHDVRRHHALVNLRYEIRQLQRLYRACDVLFVHSEYQKRDLIDFAGVNADRVLIVPHGPYSYGPPSASKEELRHRYGIPLNKQVALFFGDIRPDKNLDLLLRAMVPYKDRLLLFVAGRPKGGAKSTCRDWGSFVAQLGLRDAVHLDLQYIPDQKVADYFELCDWVVLPYSSSFTSQSGVLNVAIAHRRPVLITETPTIREALAECPVGVAAMPDDLLSLRKGIEQFLEHGCERFDSSIYQYLARFTWARNAAVTSQAYREALS